jgi:hypothetical protein
MQNYARRLEGMRIEIHDMIQAFERDKTREKIAAVEHLTRARQAVGLANAALAEKKESNS